MRRRSPALRVAFRSEFRWKPDIVWGLLGRGYGLGVVFENLLVRRNRL